MEHSKLSIIIPTYNAQDLLRETLDCLVDQTVSTDLYEVIIADDGSSDNTKEVVQDFSSLLDIHYYYQEDDGFRLAAARNLGLEHAKYPLVLFFDCGMIATEDLVEKHLMAHKDQPDSVLIGLSYGVEEYSTENAKELTQLINTLDRTELFSELSQRKNLYDCRYDTCQEIDFDLSKTRAPWVMCWGGHVSCSTQTLKQIGGCDEAFRSWGGEDVDMAIRLFEHGCQFKVLKSLHAIHKPHYRCGESNKASSMENIKYIVNKYKQPDVSLLSEHGWEAIFKMTLREVEAV